MGFFTKTKPKAEPEPVIESLQDMCMGFAERGLTRELAKVDKRQGWDGSFVVTKGISHLTIVIGKGEAGITYHVLLSNAKQTYYNESESHTGFTVTYDLAATRIDGRQIGAGTDSTSVAKALVEDFATNRVSACLAAMDGIVDPRAFMDGIRKAAACAWPNDPGC